MVGIIDSTAAPNEAKYGASRRSQGKRSRMKWHQPKVLDQAKIGKKASTPKPMQPSTPNPWTPKRPKSMKNDGTEKSPTESVRNIDLKEVSDSNEKFCRRKIDFDCSLNQSPNVRDEVESKPEVGTKQLQSAFIPFKETSFSPWKGSVVDSVV